MQGGGVTDRGDAAATFAGRPYVAEKGVNDAGVYLNSAPGSSRSALGSRCRGCGQSPRTSRSTRRRRRTAHGARTLRRAGGH